jgi:hypothetical protein
MMDQIDAHVAQAVDEIRASTRTCAVVLIAAIVVLLLVLLSWTVWAGEQQAVFGGPAVSAPWWIILAVIGFPGGLGVLLTVASVVYVRRVNRDEGRLPLTAWQVGKWALTCGAIYGPVCQYGFQGLVQFLTGTPVFWELVVIAPVITGPASMVAYELLRAMAKDRWPKLYALISVKHSSARGHAGDTPDGDLTELDHDRTDLP